MNEHALTGIGQLAMQSAKTAPHVGRVGSMQAADKVAQDFEAFFLGQMLQPLFASISVEPPFGGGNAEQVWRSLMVDEMGKAMAKNGGIGIADSVKREILRLQEMQQ